MVFVRVFLFSLLVISAYGLPITAEHKENKVEPQQNLENALEYERYLKEVVNILESDKEFRKKIENATEEDIRTGKIAMELAYVDHHVRSKLDEVKLAEVNRLRKLALKKSELSNHLDREHLRVPEHVNHITDTFEIEDLVKLITKASKDLAELDKQRREEFKQYEMQKEFEKQQQLHALDDESRKRFEEDLKQKEEKHKKHEPLHYPGRKAQLEEVWEKQDHMPVEDFDPLKFFQTHDLDGNDYLDQLEVEALFQKELDKAYESGKPEDDMRERAEERERMREEFFRLYDQNHDNLVSIDEFLEITKRQEFLQDREWETLDPHQQFTEEEYKRFERQRQEEVDRYIREGKYSPEIDIPAGYHRRPHQQMEHPSQQMGHPSQQMNQHYQQPGQQQYQQPGQQQYQPAGQQYHQQGQQYQQPGQQYQQPGQPNNQGNQIHYNQVNQGPPGGNVQYAPPGSQYHSNNQPGQPQYQGNMNTQYNPNVAPNQAQYNGNNAAYVPTNNQYPPGNQPNQGQANVQQPPNNGQFNPNVQASQNSGNQPNQINNNIKQDTQNLNKPSQNQPAPNSINEKGAAQKQP